jgi:hypothetical protein
LHRPLTLESFFHLLRKGHFRIAKNLVEDWLGNGIHLRSCSKSPMRPP